ncbi:MAG TPA: hypothetical protein VG102_04045 [Candidatus Paceibacterota bacterium]|jgi:uncharacterized membrane protein YphA (DoxX/SURF4 family)|nr:hypothetical protein [Candidatus Paceibacterota bacterium]
MLSLFPGLLFLAPLATAMLRVAAGLTFIYIAYRMVVARDEISRARVIIVGHIRGWMVWTSALVTLAVGILLCIGLWTQGAAIVGMLIALKHGLGVRSYSSILPLSGVAYFLLFVICLSLLFSGAGAFSIDLPL